MNITIGDTFLQNCGTYCQVIDIPKGNRCIIKWLDEFEFTKSVRKCHMVDGKCYNPYARTNEGVGYTGVGNFTPKTDNLVYSRWRAMFKRCYNDKYLEWKPSYKGCHVSTEWHNFQNFAEWFYSCVYGKGIEDMSHYHLDKDVLLLENKIYSSETCRLIPHYLNSVLSDSFKIRGDLPLGVTKHSTLKDKFSASIKDKRTVVDTIYLGLYSTPQDAHKAWQKAKITVILQRLEEYSAERLFYQEIYDSLLLRVNKIRKDIERGEQTYAL